MSAPVITHGLKVLGCGRMIYGVAGVFGLGAVATLGAIGIALYLLDDDDE